MIRVGPTGVDELARLLEHIEDPHTRAQFIWQHVRRASADLVDAAAAGGVDPEAVRAIGAATQAPSILHRILGAQAKLLELAADEASRLTLAADVRAAAEVLGRPTDGIVA